MRVLYKNEFTVLTIRNLVSTIITIGWFSNLWIIFGKFESFLSPSKDDLSGGRSRRPRQSTS
jgi:hypothetical protein